MGGFQADIGALSRPGELRAVPDYTGYAQRQLRNYLLIGDGMFSPLSPTQPMTNARTLHKGAKSIDMIAQLYNHDCQPGRMM